MIYSLHRFGCMFDEYFLYNFPLLNVNGREEFITDKERWSFYARLNNDAKVDLFDNKGKTIEKFMSFYNRDVCIVKTNLDRPLADDFVSRHQKIIVKPLDSSGGRGVRIVTVNDYNFEQLLKDYKTGFLAEEVVSNSPEISQFNPSSLNTVRIATVRKDNATDILFTFIRFGRAGKCVDNGFSGGLISNIDIETGVITSCIDENNSAYIYHPDSKQQIIGFKIPRWEEAILLAKKLSEVVPEYHFVGWDLALTENGWVMIEGNRSSQFVGPQMSERIGIKNKLLKYLN